MESKNSLFLGAYICYLKNGEAGVCWYPSVDAWNRRIFGDTLNASRRAEPLQDSQKPQSKPAAVLPGILESVATE